MYRYSFSAAVETRDAADRIDKRLAVMRSGLADQSSIDIEEYKR